MFFSTLKSAIQVTEEKRFYDVAVLYLLSRGFGNLSIVDGTGDGGIDVTSNKENVRIQLSIRKKWEDKINEEGKKTIDAGKNHLIYITNRTISPEQEADFIANKFKYRNDVDVSIHDLKRISTALSLPEYSRKAYELLGISIPERVEATLPEIATSTLMLFSSEAKELRGEIIEANVKALLFKDKSIEKNILYEKAINLLQYDNANADSFIKKTISRLLALGQLISKNDTLSLSDNEFDRISVANDNFLAMKDTDITVLSKELNIGTDEAGELLENAIELLVKNRDFEGEGAIEESFRSFISQPQYRNRKEKIFNLLSNTNIAKLKQHAKYVEQILKTNTFDIYRALGQRAHITMLLDSSVAMPIMFGLEFGDSTSRFEIAANALKNLCKSHNIEICIPKSYLNEMAAHGRLAFEKQEIYEALPLEAKTSLKASKNAYISHYTHISEKLSDNGEKLTLEDFLRHFGITQNCSIMSIENKIQSILERHGINIVHTPPKNEELRQQVYRRKIHDDDIIVDHDAEVLTLVKDDVKKGFVLATWDYVMRDLVQNIARVLADTPTRVIDFLSMAKSSNFSSESNIEIINTLLYIDEHKIYALAEKLDKINNLKQVYKLQSIIDEARLTHGKEWNLEPEDIQIALAEIQDSPGTVRDEPVGN